MAAIQPPVPRQILQYPPELDDPFKPKIKESDAMRAWMNQITALAGSGGGSTINNGHLFLWLILCQ